MSAADNKIKDQTGALAVDYGELVLDAMLDDGLAKDVPVVGAFFKLASVASSLREKFFYEKVCDFLREVSKSPEAERLHFLEELTNKHGTRQKAGHAILHMIDRLDDLAKPELVGRIYLARIQGRITYEEMLRFSMVVERSFLSDLLALRTLKSGDRIDPVAAPMFESLSIAELTGENYGTFDGVGAETWHELNELGQKFVRTAFATAQS